MDPMSLIFIGKPMENLEKQRSGWGLVACKHWTLFTRFVLCTIWNPQPAVLRAVARTHIFRAFKRSCFHGFLKSRPLTGFRSLGTDVVLEILLMEEIRQTHQLRLVVFFHYFTRFSTSQVVQDFFHQQY